MTGPVRPDEALARAVVALRAAEHHLQAARIQAATAAEQLRGGPRSARGAELHGLVANVWNMAGKLAFVVAADLRYLASNPPGPLPADTPPRRITPAVTGPPTPGRTTP